MVLAGRQIALHEVDLEGRCEQIQWGRVYETASWSDSRDADDRDGDDVSIARSAASSGRFGARVSRKPREVAAGGVLTSAGPGT
jgi:hypothetical protein